eukprot:NODE_5571_length_566_cov_84.951644_g4840_i0.p1 GENE.NODE_5571_length_566_cov_84.951644_g4840_i0~~NODE_5571_length_566_cov_84.951644_g4840_i0.p1  ORF type:complete len:126 (-),score=12.37 NODE_5571_length_566_cov_84.951644_g4840_i0:59-436(-)
MVIATRSCPSSKRPIYAATFQQSHLTLDNVKRGGEFTHRIEELRWHKLRMSKNLWYLEHMPYTASDGLGRYLGNAKVTVKGGEMGRRGTFFRIFTPLYFWVPSVLLFVPWALRYGIPVEGAPRPW